MLRGRDKTDARRSIWWNFRDERVNFFIYLIWIVWVLFLFSKKWGFLEGSSGLMSRLGLGEGGKGVVVFRYDGWRFGVIGFGQADNRVGRSVQLIVVSVVFTILFVAILTTHLISFPFHNTLSSILSVHFRSRVKSVSSRARGREFSREYRRRGFTFIQTKVQR